MRSTGEGTPPYIGANPIAVEKPFRWNLGGNKTERRSKSAATHQENNSDRGAFPCQKPQIRKTIMNWDFVKTPRIIKILPVIMWHKEKRLLEFGWIIWSFIILVK